MSMQAQSWRVERCQACREPIIHAVGSKGEPVKVDAEPSKDGELALTVRFEGRPPLAFKPKPALAFGRPLRKRHSCRPVFGGFAPAPPRPGSAPVLRLHLFDPYPSDGKPDDPGWLPPEPHTGRRICKVCKAPGAAGDQRHPADLSPPRLAGHVADAAVRRDAAILGEKDEEQ